MKDEEKKDNPVESAGESKPEEKKPEEPAGADQAEQTPPETPPKEEKPDDPPTDAAQGEENGEGAKPENADAPPPEAPTEGAPEPPAEDVPAEPAAENTSDELLLARAELSAIKSGMSVSVAEDAVVLAMHDLKKDGAVPDQAGLEKALKGVLKRHPEWDAKKQQGAPAGFKVGADGSQNQNSAEDDAIARVFGNK